MNTSEASKYDVVEYLQSLAGQLADKVVENKNDAKAFMDRRKLEEAIEVVKAQS